MDRGLWLNIQEGLLLIALGAEYCIGISFFAFDPISSGVLNKTFSSDYFGENGAHLIHSRLLNTNPLPSSSSPSPAPPDLSFCDSGGN